MSTFLTEVKFQGGMGLGAAFAPQQPMMLAVIVRDAGAGHCSLTVAQRPAETVDGFVLYTFPELAMARAAAYELCLHHLPPSSAPQDFWARLVSDLPADVEDPLVECPARPWLPAALGLKTERCKTPWGSPSTTRRQACPTNQQ